MWNTSRSPWRLLDSPPAWPWRPPLPPSPPAPPPSPPVPLRRTFEVAIANDATKVENKFSDVWLNASFTGPPKNGAAEPVHFWGFYDGGSTWRLRFMPSAVGLWKYSFSFSDGSLSGEGTFECVAAGASPGVLKPWPANPHW